MASAQQASLGDIIDKAPWSRFQRFAAVLAMLAIVIDGVANQIFGLAIPSIIEDWHVSRAAFELPVALGFFGMALGAYIIGLAGDRIGRRWTLILSVALFGAMTALSAYAATPSMLGILRFGAGLGLGGTLPNATSLIADMTPVRHRVLAVSLGSIGMPIGNALCGIMASQVLPKHGWQGLMLWGGFSALALALLFVLLLPESPRILARSPRHVDALHKSLVRMGIAADATAFGTGHADAASGTGSGLLNPRYRRDTLALWFSFIFTMLVLYSVVSWAPTLIRQQGFALAAVGQSMAAFGIGSIVGGLVTAALVVRYGSRVPLALAGFAGLATGSYLAMFGIHVSGGNLSPAIALFAIGFLVSAIQNTLYAMGVHIYPASLRAQGLGTGLAIGRFGAVASALAGMLLSARYGAGQGFFAMIAIVFGLIVVALMGFRNPIPARRSNIEL